MPYFIEAVNIVAPVFIIIFIGFMLKRRGFINDVFVRTTSKVIFVVTMPSLVFVRISGTNFGEVLNPMQVLFACGTMLLTFIIGWIVGIFAAANGRDRGAFIQGSFRGNFAILAFALIYNAFGQEALASAAILLAFVMPLFNLFAIIALTVTLRKENQISALQTIKEIITNPLIIAAIGAVPFSYFQIPLPSLVSTSLDYLAAMTLPLALMGIGGSLSFRSVKEDLFLAGLASFLKVIVSPVIAMYLALKLNFTPVELGVLFFFFATPTAVASYIMAEAMGSNGRLAGNIILLSTVASIFTISIGVIIFKSMGVF